MALIEALKWKYPGVAAVVTDGKIVEWTHALPRPDEKQAAAIETEYQAYLAANAYQADRAEEYPPLGDQLDAIWKIVQAINAGDSMPADALAVMAAVQAIKDKYPKPEGK